MSHVYPEAAGARVTKLSVGTFDNNVYVITCLATGEELIVDGAAEPEWILQTVASARVVGIVQTHSHPDHVQALPALVSALDAPVYAHQADGTRMPVPTQPLAEGDLVRVGDLDVRVMHTPGHTPGSLCFLLGRHLFSGDTLFPGGPGNTFGRRDDFETIMASLDRLFALPDDTLVLPGHGADTTIGHERPDLESWRARGW